MVIELKIFVVIIFFIGSIISLVDSWSATAHVKIVSVESVVVDMLKPLMLFIDGFHFICFWDDIVNIRINCKIILII